MMQDQDKAQRQVTSSPTVAVDTSKEILLSEGKPVTASVRGNLAPADVVTSEQVTNRTSFHFSRPPRQLPCSGSRFRQNLRSRRPTPLRSSISPAPFG